MRADGLPTWGRSTNFQPGPPDGARSVSPLLPRPSFTKLRPFFSFAFLRSQKLFIDFILVVKPTKVIPRQCQHLFLINSINSISTLAFDYYKCYQSSQIIVWLCIFPI